MEEDNPALAITPVEEADTEEVEDATTVLVIAPAEGTDIVLTIVPAVEAATVLTATSSCSLRLPLLRLPTLPV